MHFDVAAHPSHVTFDDGKKLKRVLPWSEFSEALWKYDAVDTILVEIGDWSIEIIGHNVPPLFASIEEKTLLRVRAQPELSENENRAIDTFVTEVIFSASKKNFLGGKQLGQIELDLIG